MRVTTLLPLIAALASGCLTAEKRSDGTVIGPGGAGFLGGDAAADAAAGADSATGSDSATGTDTGPGGADTTTGADIAGGPDSLQDGGPHPADTATPSDTAGATDSAGPVDTAVEPDVPDPGCPDFTIDSFGLAGAPKYLHFGEPATLATALTSDGSPTISVTVSPPAMGQFFTSAGAGGGDFLVDDVDRAFRTTTVTFTLDVTAGDCTAQRTATVKVLGNVWATETSTDVVEVFRSDGSFIGQGIPSTYFSIDSGSGDPWSLLELDAGRIAVGSRHQDGVEVFDPQGNHLYAFDLKDNKGSRLYSIYGAYAMIRHKPDNRIWVGGPDEKILVYEDDGTHVETISLGFQGPQAECLIQLPNLQTVMCDDTTATWGLKVLDTEGAIIGGYGNNTTSLSLAVYRGAASPSGKLVFGGRNTISSAGHLALLEPAGQLYKQSEPIEDWKPQYGITAFGDGFLTTENKPATNDTPLALFDGDLNLLDEAWTDREGTYRGLMVFGGN